MVVEIILGIAAGIGLGYLGAKGFLWNQKRGVIRNARKRIENQKFIYRMDGIEYDLKKQIKKSGTPVPGSESGSFTAIPDITEKEIKPDKLEVPKRGTKKPKIKSSSRKKIAWVGKAPGKRKKKKKK